MNKDSFNRPNTSINFGRPEFIAVEWDDTTTADVVYLRGDYAADCLIQQINTANGTIAWAFGAWADRDTLTYGDDRLIDRG